MVWVGEKILKGLSCSGEKGNPNGFSGHNGCDEMFEIRAMHNWYTKTEHLKHALYSSSK